jgi:putative membrane protein
MKKRLLQYTCAAVTLASLAGSVALAQSTKAGSSDDKAASSVTMSDRSWVIATYRGGAEEVRLGALAARDGSSPRVQEFGKHMMDDHAQANMDLKKLADKKGIVLPDGDAKSDADYNELHALPQTDFDRKYIAMMVTGHKNAIASFQTEYRRGGDPNIKAWAGEVLPTLQHHLKMIENIQSSLAKR